jgi:alpha-D-xyloside xylohydrolase
MHNLYPLLYNEAVSEVTKSERGHGAVWGRAAVGGSQRTPVCWSGDPAADFDSLACTVRGGLSMGLSGVPFWSNDIGGYRGMPSPDLYVRWAQFGLFCSHSRMHGDSPREPWLFGDEYLAIVRRYVELRYRLFPYLYSTAIQASRTAMPVIRALNLMWPDDPHALHYDLQYMLGPALMVAPVVHPSGKKNVYLPEGKWIDFWTGEVIRGPEVLRLHVPLATLPLYIRAGSVIPMMEQGARIPGGSFDTLVLALWSDDPGTTRFADDDGETEVEVSPGLDHCSVRWEAPVPRTYHIQLHTTGYQHGALDGETARATKGSVLVRP